MFVRHPPASSRLRKGSVDVQDAGTAAEILSSMDNTGDAAAIVSQMESQQASKCWTMA